METKKLSKVVLTDSQKESLEVLRTNCVSTRQCLVEDYLNDDSTPVAVKQAVSRLLSSYMEVEFVIFNFLNSDLYE